ncbi:hypothetical protein QP166_03185 [Sphingomonas sp. LR60]|uniref:hypothetical protein n=1 Tax=Sphingomonas sp. LR60 TaxID=3050233 RepID=UPI002FE04DB8
MCTISPAALLSGLALATSMVGGSAFAADYATRDVGAWIVAASSDQKGCFITRTYPAPRGTILQFGLDMDGSNRLTLLNPNWSVRAREQLRLDFQLSNSAFPRHLAIGIAPQESGASLPTSARPSRAASPRPPISRYGAATCRSRSSSWTGAAPPSPSCVAVSIGNARRLSAKRRAVVAIAFHSTRSLVKVDAIRRGENQIILVQQWLIGKYFRLSQKT